jgi:hypothetical protein
MAEQETCLIQGVAPHQIRDMPLNDGPDKPGFDFA